jgi:plasmid replication initiation protein
MNMSNLQPPKKGAMTNVKTPQSLVHIKHTITARQYKYWYVLLKLYRDMVDAGEEADKNGFRFVPLATITDFLGYEPVKTELKKDFEALRQQPIIINYLEKDGSKATHGMGFLSEWKISSKKIGFRFPSFIEEVVRGEDDAKKMFLMLNWNIFNSFTGKYEAIIYKLCKDYIGVGRTPYMTIEEYREYIGLSDSEYQPFFKMNEWTITKPISSINENELSDIIVEVHQKTNGRKVLGIHFKVEVKKQTKLPFEEFKQHPAFDYAKVSISPEEQSKYLEKYTPEQVQAIIERANEYAKDLTGKGKQAKLGGIYQKAFAEDWGKNYIAQKIESVKLEKEVDPKRKAETEEKIKEREADEKSKLDREERERIFAIFEGQPESIQDVILDSVELKNADTPSLLAVLKKDRAKGDLKLFHVKSASKFKETMQENGLL